MKTEWVPVRDYEDLYQVSNYGQVRNKKTKEVRRPFVDRGGYLEVGLYKNGATKNITIHQIVVESFIRRYDKTTEQCNHINHNRQDCRLQNLEILSIGEHHQDQITRQRISNSKKGKKLSSQSIAKREETKRIKKALNPNYRKRKKENMI